MRWYSIALVAGLALAIASGGVVWVALQAVRAQAAPPLEVVRVIVAATDVPNGTIFDASNQGSLLMESVLPIDQVPRDAVNSMSGLVGKVLLGSLPKGAVLTSTLLAQAPGIGAFGVLPPGTIAFAVAPGDSGGLPAIQATDLVDLIVSLPVRQPDGSSQQVTQLLYRDLPILAVNGEPTHPADARTPPATPPKPVTNVTLAVTPQAALEIQHLINSGTKLVVLAHPPGITTGDLTTPVTTDSIERRLGLVNAP